MTRPPIILDPTPPGWLTIPELCAWLQVTEAEWNTWRAAGLTPPHVAGPDGQLRIRSTDLDRWLDELSVEPENELTAADLAAWDTTRDESAALAPVVRLDPGRRAHVERGPGRRVARHRGGPDGQR